MAITRTPWIDDDGSGTTGTVLNNAEKTLLYNQIDAAVINPTDNVTLGAGRIIFPITQNPSSDPNALDDYEEGTWTPLLKGAGGSSGVTHTVQVGRYVKVGRLVFVSGRVQLSAKGTMTGQITLDGLPFPTDSLIYAGLVFASFGGLAIAPNALYGQFDLNVRTISLFVLRAAGTAVTAVTGADLTDAFGMIFSATYCAIE